MPRRGTLGNLAGTCKEETLDSYWQKSHFLRSKGLKTGAGRAARVAASLGLVVGLFGPNPFSSAGTTPTAQADLLKWDDARMPATDLRDSTGPYAALPIYGTLAVTSAGGGVLTHPVTVAPNGDVFTAGKSATGAAAVIYKSTDGGLTWQAGNNGPSDPPSPFAAVLGSRVVSIAVPPKYPQDNRVYAAFTDDIVGADTGDGVVLSTDGGNTFKVIADGTAATATKAMIAALGTGVLTSVALSTDFDGSTSAGELTVGTWQAGASLTTATLTGAGLFSGSAAATVVTSMGAAIAGATDVNVLSLAYSPGDVIRLAALVGVNGGANLGTYGTQRTSATKWTCCTLADANVMSQVAVAVAGKVAFPDTFSSGGAYYAGWTDSLAGAPSVPGAGTLSHAGVYRFDGTSWQLRNGTGAPVGAAITDIAVAGAGSSANILAAEGGNASTSSTRVFSSTNAGSSWTDSNLVGDSPITRITTAAGAQGKVGVAKDFVTSGKAYVSHNGTLGGLLRTTNGASNFQGTALINGTPTAVGFTVPAGSTDTVFVRTSTTTATGGLFKGTAFSSTSGGYRQVERSGDISSVYVAGTFATTNTVYLRRSGAGKNQIVKSTDGGESFVTTNVKSPDQNQVVTTMSWVSATQGFAGTDDGKVYVTTDGANSWGVGVKVGDKIDSFVRSPNFATDNTIFAEVDGSGSVDIWMSTDGGMTFPTKVGTASGAWGTGIGAGTPIASPNFATDKMLFYSPNNPVGSSELYRIKIGDTAWTKMGSGTANWGTITATAAKDVGDGILFRALKRTTQQIAYTYYPLTVNEGNWSKNKIVSLNLADNIPAGYLSTTGSFSTATLPDGSQRLQVNGSGAHAGRVLLWTDTKSFLTPPTLIQPTDNGSIPTNVGNDGIPPTLTWSAVDRTQCYDVQIAIDAAFEIPILDGSASVSAICPGTVANPANAATIVTVAASALSQGNTYYWRVRVHSVGPSTAAGDLSYEAGPWSKANKFAVGNQGAPTSPDPQLPLDGSTLPSLATTLSWNNPAGTTQFQVQVLPLNMDGPGIDLIIGDPAQVNSATYQVTPPVMGQGNYVMLPGASYTWRVRVTNKSGSIASNDPSWGPWSTIRTFKTPKPNGGSITLNPVTASATPTVSWKDSNTANFYYEVQMSADPTFNVDPNTATAAVFWNLVHGGISNPLNSWTVPSAFPLPKARIYWRVRQRVQATPLGADEPGVAWTATGSFVVS
jgi:hypothetical protein